MREFLREFLLRGFLRDAMRGFLRDALMKSLREVSSEAISEDDTCNPTDIYSPNTAGFFLA